MRPILGFPGSCRRAFFAARYRIAQLGEVYVTVFVAEGSPCSINGHRCRADEIAADSNLPAFCSLQFEQEKTPFVEHPERLAAWFSETNLVKRIISAGSLTIPSSDCNACFHVAIRVSGARALHGRHGPFPPALRLPVRYSLARRGDRRDQTGAPASERGVITSIMLPVLRPPPKSLRMAKTTIQGFRPDGDSRQWNSDALW